MNLHTALHRDLAATRIADLHRHAATRRTATLTSTADLTLRTGMIRGAMARVARRANRPVTPVA